MPPTTSTTKTQLERAAQVSEVRELIADALRSYAATPEGAARTEAGLTATDLADGVRSWTHLTRVADFIEAHAARLAEVTS